MKTVNRSELLALLEAISHGLSPRDIIEQSSCFVFQEGEVMTYNDEVACRARTSLNITGAVQAKPFKAILEKMPEDELQIQTTEGELLVIGKRRKIGIRMENEVLLPFANVERPKKFKPLHEDFLDAVNMAQECTSRDENKFWSTCVHLHPKWVEATDQFKILRYRLKTGVSESQLVRGRAIKCITSLDVHEFCETDNWIHFKNKDKLIVSCRRWVEPYKSEGISRNLKIEGTKTTLPKGLGESAERAEVFSAENVDNNQIQVVLSPGKLRIKGEGVSGWFSETKKLKYKGPKLDFFISPGLLIELTQRHNECEVSDRHLKVNGGRFTFMACLSLAGEKDNEDQEKKQEDRNAGSSSEED